MWRRRKILNKTTIENINLQHIFNVINSIESATTAAAVEAAAATIVVTPQTNNINDTKQQ